MLPGFQFRLDDLYTHPDFRERLNDSVYTSFILLDYQAAERHAKEAEQRAKTERQRAEAADQRAEAERQRAERLAAMLRTVGIDPDR